MEVEEENWGHCKTCKFFASPAHVPLGSEEARCAQPTFARFALTVYGSCGCNAWAQRPGMPKEGQEQQRGLV
jgi:hypothetical protein